LTKLRIILLTQYFPPEIGAPQTRLALLARLLTARGHQVTVLTAMPNYPKGQLYPGYGGLFRRAKVDGVEIIRSYIYPSQKASFLPRMGNYFSFVLSSALVGSFSLKRADYLIVESPPLFLGMAAYWLSRLKRTRLVFNVADPWPEKLANMGILRPESLIYRLSARLEAFCYKKAWLVTAQEKGVARQIQRDFPRTRTYFFSNGADTAVFGPDRATPEARRLLAGKAAYLAVFAGSHNLIQGLDYILDAAEILQGQLDLQFAFVGEGPEKARLVEQANRRGLKNVSFFEARPVSEIPPLLAAADILLAPLKKDIPHVVHVKMYEAMATGRPVILIANPASDAAAILSEHQAGLTVEPGNIPALVEALKTLCANAELRRTSGENGRRTAEAQFDRVKLTGCFIDYLEENR
jgi:colanic acid biosynthesis glycosyl transferase WcaI